eukprot:gene4834-8419_t
MSATVKCAQGAMLSFDAEEFFNEENTGVKFYFAQDYEEQPLSAPRVLFFRRVGRAFRRVARGIGRGLRKAARGVGRGFKKAVRHVGRGIKKVGRGIKRVARHVGRGIRKVGRGLKRVARHVGRGIKHVARGVGRVAKRVGRGIARVAKKTWKVIKKVAKVIAKPFVSMYQAAKKAFSKSKKVRRVLKNYIGPKQKGGCASKYVCHYDCGTLIQCPVKSNTFNGFMDITNRVKASNRETTAYKWVCKNSMFSGKSQKDSKLSKLFRRIAFGVTDKEDKEFEARNPNYSETKYDKQYLDWLRQTSDPRDMEILDILNDYKDGLSGFSKICRENPKWMNDIEKNLRSFEANSIAQSVKTSGVEADSTAKAFKKIKEYRRKQERLSYTNKNAKYRHTLLESIFKSLRDGFIKLAKGNEIQQEYCLCSDYGRFFDLMNKLSPNVRNTYYGLDNIDFQNFYMQNLKMTCISRCSDAMKKRGYSNSQIQATLKSSKLNIDLNPDKKLKDEDKKNNVDKTVPKVIKNVSKNVSKKVSKKVVKNVRKKVVKKVVKKPVYRVQKLFGSFKKVAKKSRGGNPFGLIQVKKSNSPTKEDVKQIIKNPLVKLKPTIKKLQKLKSNPFELKRVNIRIPTKVDKKNIIKKK